MQLMCSNLTIMSLHEKTFRNLDVREHRDEARIGYGYNHICIVFLFF